MQTSSIQQLSPELISEIISYLDYPDLENAFSTCRIFYYARPFVLFPAIEERTAWLKCRENSVEIPRDELVSHNAFLRILNRTYMLTRPNQHVLDALVSYFAQELIAAWMVPMNIHGAEIRCNNSAYDAWLYHRRYPLLRCLAMILQYNGVGPRIAYIVQEWMNKKWSEIEHDPELQEFKNPNLSSNPSRADLVPHHKQVLQGFERLALYPIIYYGPQDAAAEDLRSHLNDVAWTHPGFDRLKLWLSITDLWNLDIRHMEIQTLLNPWRVFRRIASRPLLQLVLFKSAEFASFSLRILSYIRSIESTTPYPDLIRGSRYWYEEAHCGSVVWWTFYSLGFPGQYLSRYKQPFIDLIRGYIHLYGPVTLSDLVLNIVYFIHWRSLPVRIMVARTVMSELLIYGYEFLSDHAREAIIGLMRDETGKLVTRQVCVNHANEAEAPRGERRSR